MDDNELEKLKMNVSAEFLEDLERILSSVKCAKIERKRPPAIFQKTEWNNNSDLAKKIKEDDDYDIDR